MTEEKNNKAQGKKKEKEVKPKEKKIEDKKQNPEKSQTKKTEEKKEVQKEENKAESKAQDKKIEKPKEEKKKEIKKPKVKKEYAIVNGKSLPISTKQATAICKFISRKKIPQARRELEEVIKKKKAIPMKGEIAHRKGKKIMSGKYPLKASKIFIELLKSLAGNTLVNNLDDPIIYEAIANKASRPMARFGRWERKRTHVKIIAKDIKQNKKQK